ncbi:DUF3108 domain-containing protein [Ectothiorhodospiraceae bacterium 2226]|nr:DUF3108 domain-containing protein [Ectothiorhodospiraceae bacterium 2226]
MQVWLRRERSTPPARRGRGWVGLRSILFGLALLAWGSAHALPDAFSASYVASARGFTLGSAQVEFSRDGGSYRYSSELRPSGVVRLAFSGGIHELSRGTLTEDGVASEAYDYRRTGRDGREDTIRFGSSGAVMSYKDRVQAYRLPEVTVDPLSLHLALMRDVAAGAQRMRYVVVEPRRVKAYEVEVRGRERIRTPNGEYEAVRVDVVGEATLDRPATFDLRAAELPPAREQTTFWFAPELDYLLVRMQHVDEDVGAATLELREERIDSRLSKRPGE